MVNKMVYGILKGYWKKQMYIHGKLNDTLKLYDIVYQQYFKRNINIY